MDKRWELKKKYRLFSFCLNIDSMIIRPNLSAYFNYWINTENTYTKQLNLLATLCSEELLCDTKAICQKQLLFTLEVDRLIGFDD